MDLIRNTLNSYLKGSQRFGTNQIIARYLINHLEDIPSLRLAEVAQACNVSTPSVIRFCRELGFEDYTDFKHRVQDEPALHYGIAGFGTHLCLTQSEEDYRASAAQLAGDIREQVQKTLLGIDRDKVALMASDILKYRYVYLYGMSLSTVFAEYLRIFLIFEHKTLNTRHSVNLTAPLTPERDQTMAIVVSQHGRFLSGNPQLLPYLRTNCDKLWMITQMRDTAPYRAKVDEILPVCGADSVVLELHGMLSVAELLADTVDAQNKQ